MKRFLIATAISVGLAANAYAADLARPAPAPAPVYTKAPPLATYSWTGFYIGGNVGGAWGSFDPSTSLAFSPFGWFNVLSTPQVTAAGQQSIKPSSIIGGVQVGYNWQTGSLVLGVEGDFDWMHLSGSASTGPVTYACCGPAAFVLTSQAHTDWLATARGRIGFAADNWLFFATGGAAFTDLHASFGFTDNCASTPVCGGAGTNANEAVSLSSTEVGWTAGGGVEYGIGPQWSVKAEYLYVAFPRVSGVGFLNPVVFGSNNNPFTHTFDLKANIARLGVNYRF